MKHSIALSSLLALFTLGSILAGCATAPNQTTQCEQAALQEESPAQYCVAPRHELNRMDRFENRI